jgi:hypothetical protein
MHEYTQAHEFSLYEKHKEINTNQSVRIICFIRLLARYIWFLAGRSENSSDAITVGS